MTPDWEQTLDPIHRVVVRVAFVKQRREITNYSVVLTMEHAGREVTVRVYDSAHGINDLHRHTETSGNSRPRPSTTVVLAKACAPR